MMGTPMQKRKLFDVIKISIPPPSGHTARYDEGCKAGKRISKHIMKTTPIERTSTTKYGSSHYDILYSKSL